MNFLKQLGCAAAVALFTTGAYAAPVMNDWVFNPTGGGYESGQRINEYLDVNGNAFIQLNRTGANSFTFREHAVFNIVQADSNGQPFPMTFAGGNITATLEAFGSGTFGGDFSFTGGTIRMYQNSTNNQYGTTNGFYGANLGSQIGQFDVLVGGGGMVDVNGSPISNGQVSVFAEAQPGMLAAGYFFDSKGVDLSTTSLLAFAFTNANTLSRPPSRLVSELACQYAGFTGPGCGSGAYSNTPGQHFLVGGNGQFKLSEIRAEVPEPASVALFGVALAGIGAARRRKKSA